MSSYNQPTNKEVPEEFYLVQEIEIDAIAFAHKMMIEYFQVKTIIPKLIRAKIEKSVIEITRFTT